MLSLLNGVEESQQPIAGGSIIPKNRFPLESIASAELWVPLWIHVIELFKKIIYT